MALQAGTYLHDRYRVGRRIGRGGMGAVYEAVDIRLHNTVAVKQLEIGGAAADRAFEREAQLLAGLRHPVLPVVIDYFLSAHDAFLVMQYIEGEDLEHHLARQQRPCAREDVLAWARALLDGLEYLHSRTPSIVHRDIKPANVKRTPAGEIVLLDFGLAKGRLGSDPTVSPDSGLYGFTLQYAPPEQIDGRPTDVRTDIFALGATLYHLATGAPPATALQRTMAVRNGAPDPLLAADAIHPPVGRVLGAALDRALQLDPAKRFASAAEMRSALSAAPAPDLHRAEPTTAERRVDAALPTQVELGRQTDLIVQVRFADSPRLGIEDWPTARRPERVEQQSEPLQVRHNVDPTGRLLPARVRIKIVAADFAIEGDAERVIEVPAHDYSKRMAFLLTPQRAGFCRVNVEVYALDSLFLGTVAVEAEAVGAQVNEATPNVAHVVLGTFARRAAAASPPRPAVNTTADTVKIKISPELAAALAEPTVAAAAKPREEASTIATILAPVPIAPPSPARSAVAPSPLASPATPAPPVVARPASVAAAPVAPRPASVAQPPAPAPLVAPSPRAPVVPAPPPATRAFEARVPPPRASFASRLPMFGGAAAAVLIAGIVFAAWPQISRSLNPPSTATLSPAPAASPPAATSPAATPPATSLTTQPAPAAAPPATTRPTAASPAPAVTASEPVAAAPRPSPAPPTTPPATREVERPAPVTSRPAPVSASPPPSSSAPPPTPAPRVAEPRPPAPAPAPPAAAPTAPTPPPPPAPPPSPAVAEPRPPATAPAPAPPPAPVEQPAPAAASAANQVGGSSTAARLMETGKKQEASGELAQALQTYEQARQLLEVEVARYKESLEKGFVTRKRVEAVEAAFSEAAQSVTRVRARLDAQRPRKK